MTEYCYVLHFPIDVVVQVTAESPEDAQSYARRGVIDELCRGDLVRREIYINDPDVQHVDMQEIEE